jgi:hypothetical protein
MKRSATVAALILSSSAIGASENSLRQISGRYEVPSQCSVVGPNGYEPCGPDNHDYLELNWISDRSASFELFSVQVNAHQCAVSGVAELKGDSLVFVDKYSLDPGQGIRIQLIGETIVLSYLKPVPPRQFPPYCGTRAYLENVKFPTQSRITK